MILFDNIDKHARNQNSRHLLGNAFGVLPEICLT